MKTQNNSATLAESIIIKCREIYGRYGYSRFLMSKFEDYDLYVENKSFLVSDSILSFTDKSGKLKALKPDVTLSIVKNLGEDGRLPVKVFYNENVYRPADGGREFREIMQLGLEHIGNCDLYSTAEVIMLAEMSLREISEKHILDISHMGLLRPLIESALPSHDGREALTDALRRRSTDTIRRLVPDPDTAETLCRLVSEYAPAAKVLPLLHEMLPDNPAVDELDGICRILETCGLSDYVFLDLSLMNDLSYYNGIIFQGFVDGIPSAVLSGGRYDPLLARFGKSCGACGFAIYLDRLSALEQNTDNETDILLLYDDNDEPSAVALAVKRLICEGNTVVASKCRPTGIQFGRVMKISEVLI